jgi:hypothetical protein
MKKVIDYFLFFNEKELLELRLNLLKDHVDVFVISELNYTHSGIKKDFICKDYIKQLGFDGNVTVLETKIDQNNLIANELDLYNSSESKSDKEVHAWTRERIQRDALLDIIDQYEDDVVFISGDCDEIIDPKFINYFSHVCRNSTENIIKIPLILFEGSSDKRLYQGKEFVPWMNSLLMCTTKQLKNTGTLTKMRSNVMNEYSPVWITEGGKLIQDCGWHFTWMGDTQRRKEKAESFIHYANLSSVNTLSSDSAKEVMNNKSFVSAYEKRNYPIQLLPRIIFDLPRVKNFLLPSEKSLIETDIKKDLLNLYEKFDHQYGEWGWCSNEKSNKIIDYTLEVCKNQLNPICVEVGVYGGKSLFPFALALKKMNKGIVYGIDPWENKDALVGYDHPSHQQFWGNIDLHRMYNICVHGINELSINDYVSLLRVSSDNSEQIKDISILHIDGQHTDQLIRDINKFAVHIIENGYCLVDDVEWSEETKKSISLMKNLGFEQIDEINGCYVYVKRIHKFL